MEFVCRKETVFIAIAWMVLKVQIAPYKVTKKQNRNIPQWFRMKTNNTIRYNSKRRHWRRTKIGL